MTLNANLLAIVTCPSCKGKLVWNTPRTELVCRGEQLAYPVVDGIPALLADAAREITTDELAEVEKP